MKKIGLMGGMRWQGSAAYYRTINRQVQAQLGGLHSARVLLDSLDFDPIGTALSKADFAEVQKMLVRSAEGLEQGGAEVLVIACNTVHRLAPAIEAAIEIPFLHIADVAGAALVRDGHQRVGLLGTRPTMESGFYRKRLAASMGLEIVVPEPEVRGELDKMIATELATAPATCADRIDGIVRALADEGCTAVLLACTEFGMAFESQDEAMLKRDLPLYDTAILHAEAAVAFALA